MDANYTVDEVLCTRRLSLNPLPLHGKQKMTIKFNDVRPLDSSGWGGGRGEGRGRVGGGREGEKERRVREGGGRERERRREGRRESGGGGK